MRQSDIAKTLVTFWGTRGSVSTPGRVTEKYGGNTPCITVSHQGATIILDAGTGIRNLGLDLADQSERQGRGLSLHLFLSHTHWDHIQGLPFFQPAFKKETELTIYGSPKKGRFLDSILKGQMDSNYFPVSMSDFSAGISIQEISEEVIQIGPMTVDWQEQVFHPGGSVRYRFRINGKKIIYATDVELNRIFDTEDTTEDKDAILKDYQEFVEDADLLIADGQYTEQEYTRKHGWGHSSVTVLLDIASQAHVKQLAIFHHDPQHSDRFLDNLLVENGSKWHENYGIEFFWAREGMTLAV